MKTNLKNFPNINDEKYALPDGWTYEDQVDKYTKYIKDTQEWLEDFEKELREQLTPRILDAMAELVDDRSDFMKGWKIGYVDCLKQILGET